MHPSWNVQISPSRVDVVLRGRPTKSLTPPARLTPRFSPLPPRDSAASTLSKDLHVEPRIMRGSNSCSSLVGEWDDLKMSAFTKRQPRTRDRALPVAGCLGGACICWEPASASFQGLVNKRTWANSPHYDGQPQEQQCIKLCISLSNTVPPLCALRFYTPTLQPLDTTMPDVPGQ